MSHGQHNMAAQQHNMRESCKNSLKLSFRNTWPQKHTDNRNAEKTAKRKDIVRYHPVSGRRNHRVREMGSCSTAPSQQMSTVAAKRCGIILKSLAHSRTARKPSLRAGEQCAATAETICHEEGMARIGNLKKVNYLQGDLMISKDQEPTNIQRKPG